jgi:hypothetical protein
MLLASLFICPVVFFCQYRVVSYIFNLIITLSVYTYSYRRSTLFFVVVDSCVVWFVYLLHLPVVTFYLVHTYVGDYYIKTCKCAAYFRLVMNYEYFMICLLQFILSCVCVYRYRCIVSAHCGYWRVQDRIG